MFDKYSAIPVTGIAGQFLGGDGDNLDLDDLRPDNMSCDTPHLRKVVKDDGKVVLQDILTSESPRLIKYDLIARKVIEEGIDPTKNVYIGYAQRVKEIRVGTQRFRMVGKIFYGDISKLENDDSY